MSFWTQVIPTLVGVVAGFIFSIALFYLTERWKSSAERKSTLRNVRAEINYNIGLLKRMREHVTAVLQDIATDTPRIYKEFEFERFQKVFINIAFAKGILYENLSSEDINRIDEMFMYFDTSNDVFANQILVGLSSNSSQKSYASSMFQQFNKKISEHLEFLEGLRKTAKKIK